MKRVISTPKDAVVNVDDISNTKCFGAISSDGKKGAIIAGEFFTGVDMVRNFFIIPVYKFTYNDYLLRLADVTLIQFIRRAIEDYDFVVFQFDSGIDLIKWLGE